MIWIFGAHRARSLMMSRLISLGSVACNSTWIPSISLLNLSFELAYNILLRTLEVSGDLFNQWINRSKAHVTFSDHELHNLCLPCTELDLALLAVILGGEIKIIDCVSAFILRDGVCEIIVSLLWIPKLFDLNFLSLLINLEHDVPVSPLCFQLHKLDLAFIIYMHPRCRVSLSQHNHLLAIHEPSSWCS